ncbi:replication initiation protein [Azohydromonas caseinilytica]|uniref:Replication initiation protein n=1 Tax=Azohydromonas caseinilytica TaxID=2728836 RepID=A0A848F9Q8_9BURK|nr:replication initiation protein [Azohydromonas caseinilytica]NML15988.1 replication initiation protein [Azohydromonas caseinilytica]
MDITGDDNDPAHPDMAREAAPATDRRRPAPRRDDAMVQKANESIAIRPKKGRLTLLSRRIYNALLYHAQQQGVEEHQYSLPLATLIGDAHFNSRNVALLKDHIREMQTTLIEWNSVGAGEQRWTSSQLLGAVEIAERGSGYPVIISWSYPDKVRERLLKPSRYTRILLEVGAQMRSYATAVLFELGMQYLTSPSRLTMREDLYWWASVLTGRSDIEKVDYRYFKRDVLRPALAEVDALQQDFVLELIEHKEGRRVAELQFRVLRRSPAAPEVAQSATFDLELVERLRQLGLKDEEADLLYNRSDEALLRATVEHVEQRLRNTALPPLTSPAAYLRDALKKGYAGVAPAPALAPAEPPPSMVQASVQGIRDEWERAQARDCEARFGALPAEEQLLLRQAFEDEALPGLMAPIVRAWERDGPASRVAGPLFLRWLARRWLSAEPTEKDLLEFAIARGMLQLG